METKGLKKVRARCGCEGCYFDTNPPCELDTYYAEHGSFPKYEEWCCSDGKESFIFIKEDTNE